MFNLNPELRKQGQEKTGEHGTTPETAEVDLKNLKIFILFDDKIPELVSIAADLKDNFRKAKANIVDHVELTKGDEMLHLLNISRAVFEAECVIPIVLASLTEKGIDPFLKKIADQVNYFSEIGDGRTQVLFPIVVADNPDEGVSFYEQFGLFGEGIYTAKVEPEISDDQRTNILGKLTEVATIVRSVPRGTPFNKQAKVMRKKLAKKLKKNS